MRQFGSWRAGWLFVGPWFITWGPQTIGGRWVLSVGRADLSVYALLNAPKMRKSGERQVNG